ncbi:MAG: hypothetical protein ABSH56_10220 [Bryobacteraceae bacterium]|jgi:hypothetical protein
MNPYDELVETLEALPAASDARAAGEQAIARKLGGTLENARSVLLCLEGESLITLRNGLWARPTEDERRSMPKLEPAP